MPCTSLDDFVGPCQQRRRDRQAEGLGGPEVYDQLELRGLLDGQVAGLRALENLVHLTGQSPDAFAVKLAVFGLVAVYHDFIIMHRKPAGAQPLFMVIRLKQGVRQCRPAGACSKTA